MAVQEWTEEEDDLAILDEMLRNGYK